MIGLVTIEYVFFIINSCTTQHVIGYKVIRQIFDILPNMIISFLAAFIMHFIKTLYSNLHVFLILFISFILFCVIYLSLAFITKNDGFKLIKGILLNFFKKKNKINNIQSKD
jgi:hypothetical protein